MEKSERYIFIGIDEDLKEAQITSYIRSYTNFLDKRCKQFPDSYKHVSDQFDENGVLDGKEFICDKKLLPPTIFKAPSKKKEMTPEEKKIAGERLSKARKPREKKVKVED